MSHKKYEFVERLFPFLVQLLVKNIISSFITENVIWEPRSFSKAQNSCSLYLNVCSDVGDLFPALGRLRKLNHQIHVSCNHYNHGSIPEYLRSLGLCLVTTSLLIDWSPYQLFKTFRFILKMNSGTASQQFELFYTRHPWKLGLICVQ